MDLVLGRLLAALGGLDAHMASGDATIELLQLGDPLADARGDRVRRLHVSEGDLDVGLHVPLPTIPPKRGSPG